LESVLQKNETAAGKKSLFGVPIPELGESPLDPEAWEKVSAKAQKIEERKNKRKERLEEESTSAQPSKVPKLAHPVRWNHRDAKGVRDSGLAPGCALVASKDSAAISEILKRKGFKIYVAQPLVSKSKDFLSVAWGLSARRQAGHLVVVDNLASSPLSLPVLAAKLGGCFLCEERELRRAVATGTVPTGVLQNSCLKQTIREIFVDDAIVAENPGLKELLAVAAELPGSKLRMAQSLPKLQKKFKEYKESHGQRSKPELHFRAIVPKEHDIKRKNFKFPRLFGTCEELFQFLSGPVNRDGSCPGW
jgi:hypothetical protein